MNESEGPTPEWGEIRKRLARRVLEIRVELYGEHGGPLLAAALGVSYRNWMRYESGEAMPAEAMLRFLEATGANPRWLLTGEGPKFARAGADG